MSEKQLQEGMISKEHCKSQTELRAVPAAVSLIAYPESRVSKFTSMLSVPHP